MGIKSLDIQKINGLIDKFKIKKAGISALEFFCLFNTVNGINVSGPLHKSEDGIFSENSRIKLITSRGGVFDSLVTSVDNYDYWGIATQNFLFPPQIGDTIFISSKKDTLSKSYDSKTYLILKSTDNRSLDISLNNPDKSIKSFTINIYNLKDTSNLGENLNGVVFLNKNKTQLCSAQIDTSTWPLYQMSNFYANLQEQDSTFTQGDSFNIRLEKRLVNQPSPEKDIVYYTEVKSAIDTTFWDAMKVNANNSVHNGAFHGDTLYFPMFVETINNGTALNQFSYNYNIKGDTIILNYDNDRAQGYIISRKKSSQDNYEIIVRTEKTQYKDVVKENGIYYYRIDALSGFGGTLNSAFFSVNKVRGLHQSKIINVFSEEDKRLLKKIINKNDVYNLSGRRIYGENDIVIGKYFIKE